MKQSLKRNLNPNQKRNSNSPKKMKSRLQNKLIILKIKRIKVPNQLLQTQAPPQLRQSKIRRLIRVLKRLVLKKRKNLHTMKTILALQIRTSPKNKRRQRNLLPRQLNKQQNKSLKHMRLIEIMTGKGDEVIEEMTSNRKWPQSS